MQCDFVDDCSAMIPPLVGDPPLFAPFTFTVRVTCVVPKGYETGVRLDILKDSVRAALTKEPLVLRNYSISSAIMSETDSREVGVRKSALVVGMKVEKLKKGIR